jgi:uroporphyrinogen-III synthase
MTTRVLVTRPAREALRWTAQLQARGCTAEALPLIAIEPTDPAPLVAIWRQIAQYRALMFVSANAVQALFAARPEGASWPADLRAWSTGPGTSRALREAGVDAALIDTPADDAPQFDSEALWQLVHGPALQGARVLIVRGADASGRIAGRPWLAERLSAAGCQVDAVAAYQRSLPVWSQAQLTQARAGAQGDALWLLSSSDAVRHLGLLLPGQDWHAARALATHERIAEAAQSMGFGQVRVSRPGLDDLLASIESWR